MSLRKKTFSAVKWTSISMFVKAALLLIQLVVLARLLTPSDFGLMALVVSVTFVAQIFSDAGISNAIIHHQKISNESLSSLFWLNVGSSLIVMLIVMAFSHLISVFYHEPRLTILLIILSSTFLISGLGQQIKVSAEKALQFNKLALIEITASVIALIVAIVIAYNGGGVYALVFGTLVNSIITTLLFWIILSNGWRPLFRFKFDEVKSFLNFGLYMIGFNLTNAVNVQADTFIGGRFLSATDLGMYSMPKDINFRLAMLINPIVTRVGLPVMATAQNDIFALKRIYLKTLLMVSSVNFPLYAFIYILAPEVVYYLLGEKWMSVIPMMQLFALWGAVRSIGNPSGSLAFALGRADIQFWWSLGLMITWIPILLFGVRYGPYGLALSTLIAMLLMPVPMWFFVIKPLCRAGFIEYFLTLSKPLFITTVTAFVTYLVIGFFDSHLLRLALGACLGLILYVGLSYKFNEEWFTSVFELISGKSLAGRNLN